MKTTHKLQLRVRTFRLLPFIIVQQKKYQCDGTEFLLRSWDSFEESRYYHFLRNSMFHNRFQEQPLTYPDTSITSNPVPLTHSFSTTLL